MRPHLSILTPGIPRRLNQADALMDRIAYQIQQDKSERFVEHLLLVDNMHRSVGLKRQALLDAARGDYIAFVDDDDDVANDYIPEILRAIVSIPDVVTFRQLAIINGEHGQIDFRLSCKEDAPWQPGKTVTRPPWHVCVWRRDISRCLFPDINDGEDRIWAIQARQRARTEVHIDKILHTYRFDSKLTAATGR